MNSKKYKEAIASTILLAAALIVEFAFQFPNHAYLYLPLYVLAYLSVGGPVLGESF